MFHISDRKKMEKEFSYMEQRNNERRRKFELKAKEQKYDNSQLKMRVNDRMKRFSSGRNK